MLKRKTRRKKGFERDWGHKKELPFSEGKKNVRNETSASISKKNILKRFEKRGKHERGRGRRKPKTDRAANQLLGCRKKESWGLFLSGRPPPRKGGTSRGGGAKKRKKINARADQQLQGSRKGGGG